MEALICSNPIDIIAPSAANVAAKVSSSPIASGLLPARTLSVSWARLEKSLSLSGIFSFIIDIISSVIDSSPSKDKVERSKSFPFITAAPIDAIIATEKRNFFSAEGDKTATSGSRQACIVLTWSPSSRLICSKASRSDVIYS